MLYTDEWGGGSAPRCRATDPMHWGADAIFSLSNRKLTLASYFKMPAPQTDMENCVAPQRLVGADSRSRRFRPGLVSGGGLSMVDFTDPSHPFEIAYFDLASPLDAVKRRALPAASGRSIGITATSTVPEIARGVDVFRLA